MQRWISHTTAPLGIILLFVYIFIFFAADYISKKILLLMNLFLIIIVILYLAFGIYTIVLASQQAPDSPFIKNAWTLLSAYSRIYYYNNDIKVLYDTYFTNMVLTGAFYIFIFIIGCFLIIFIYVYTEEIDYIWRPPLRSKIRNERAERYINYYTLFNKEYKMLLEMHNMDNSPQRDLNIKKKEENVTNKNNNIYNNVQNSRLNNENYNLINNYNINNNFNNTSYVNDHYKNTKLSQNDDTSKNQKNLNTPQRFNKSDSKKNLLSNENKIINSNIISNQISRSEDKANKNSDNNSVANHIINNVDEKTNILRKNDNHEIKSIPIPKKRLIRKSNK